ncbi:MAG: hypothetical protein IK999_11985 [Ruminococcus sp.]|nr:hypothetical protein [Ruminococcus sp.]
MVNTKWIRNKAAEIKTAVKEDFTKNSELTVAQRDRKRERAIRRISAGFMAVMMMCSAFGVTAFAEGEADGVETFNTVVQFIVDWVARIGLLSGFSAEDILPEPDDSGFLGLNYLVKYLETMPTFLILMAACWVIHLILIGRIFEIVVYTAVSPIPLSTFAAEGWHDTAKGFIKSYAAVCLQGLVVVLMFYSFSQVVELLGGASVIGITIVALSLALGVAKSGQWARQALGCG